MIVALRGLLARWDEDRLVAWVDTGGVTYELSMPAFASDWMGAQRLGEEVEVHTFQHATDRQPVPTLFGFPRLAEREFFRKFIEVPGVGPSMAVRALTRPVSEVARWIEAEDTRSLRQLPGIGDRLASTIVARLHGKLVQEALLRDGEANEGIGAPDIRTDAVDALFALQYTRREAEALVSEAMRDRPELGTVEEVLRHVLERQARGA